MSSDRIADELLKYYHQAETLEQLSLATGIPSERIRSRMRAAALCFLSLGTDRCFPVRMDRLRPMKIDWDLISFD